MDLSLSLGKRPYSKSFFEFMSGFEPITNVYIIIKSLKTVRTYFCDFDLALKYVDFVFIACTTYEVKKECNVKEQNREVRK